MILLIADRALDFFLLQGINLYYGLNSDADILIVGPSQIMLGLDKVQLEQQTGMRVAKYTREGVNLKDRYEMLCHYFASCHKSPKWVILNVDKYLFSPGDLSLNSYRLFFPFMSNPNMNQYVKENATKKEYWMRKIFHTLRYDEILLGHTIRGYLGKWTNLKGGIVDLKKLAKDIEEGKFQPRKMLMEANELQCFENLLQFLKKQNTSVILLDIPYASPLEEYNPEETAEVRKYFLNSEKINPSFYYLRLEKLAEHGEYYADKNHLNPRGQKIATSMLADFLGKFNSK